MRLSNIDGAGEAQGKASLFLTSLLQVEMPVHEQPGDAARSALTICQRLTDNHGGHPPEANKRSHHIISWRAQQLIAELKG